MYTALVLALAICSTQAMIMCPPNFCDNVKCAAVNANECDGRVKENGSVCGCCDVCMTQINHKQDCTHLMMLGIPPQSECSFGLECDFNTKLCSSKCEIEMSNMKTIMANGALGAELPKCESNGNYSAVQCKGSQCFCAHNVTGEQLGDYRANRWEADNMDCHCAQTKYASANRVGIMHFCEPNGNFSPVQCVGSVCFCADRLGKQLVGTESFPIHKVGAANC